MDEKQCNGDVTGMQVRIPMPTTENQLEPFIIATVLNGFIITCGCKRIVFETREKMLSELERYFKAPLSVAREYLAREGK